MRINGAKSPIKGFHRLRVWAGEGKTHPVYLVELPLEERNLCAPKLVQVEVSTATRGRGEAWYIIW